VGLLVTTRLGTLLPVVAGEFLVYVHNDADVQRNVCETNAGRGPECGDDKSVLTGTVIL